MTRFRLVWPAVLVAVGALLSSCSSADTVTASQDQFDHAFLQPLDASGLHYSVEEVCHHARRSSDEAWHLQVRVIVEAEPDEVADALEGDVEVIARDREPMLVQQHEGEPGRGWDGVLESRDGRTILGVTKNNATVDGDRPSVGWLPVCGDDRPR